MRHWSSVSCVSLIVLARSSAARLTFKAPHMRGFFSEVGFLCLRHMRFHIHLDLELLKKCLIARRSWCAAFEGLPAGQESWMLAAFDSGRSGDLAQDGRGRSADLLSHRCVVRAHLCIARAAS